MECYHCGAKLGREDFCPECGENVKVYKRIIVASNICYNEGLAKAGVRDLSGAAESLRASLKFNKFHTDARNLLGLVCFEMGEVVEALTEWVISKNYQPKGNRASYYLDQVQNNRASLESINQTIKKYNQALLYCRQDSKDLAIIQLKKVVSLNPRLVRGHQLLALLYMQEGKYDLAKKSLQNAGKIDSNNTTTLRYLKEVNSRLRGSNPPKAKKEDRISYQSGNETIIQPQYIKETSSSSMGTIVNMVIGIAIGVAITWFLIVPGVKRQVQNEAKTEVLEANNAISSKNQNISSLEQQVEELTNQVSAAKEDEESAKSRISSYEQLLQAYAAYVGGETEKAGTALGNVHEEYLNGDSKSLYDSLNAQINAEYLSSLYQEGYAAYNAQNFEEAIAKLEKVVEADETAENGYAIYYLAQAYRKNNDLETAKIYYQKIVELYPGTERAANAQSYLAIEE